MIKAEGFPNSAAERASQAFETMSAILAEATGAAAPKEGANDPLEVFPKPGQRRADGEFHLGPEHEPAFREAMSKLGVGRAENQGASAAGLNEGYAAIIEGGLAHKMVAEISTVLSDPVRPGFIIIAATPERIIPSAEDDKVGERVITAKVLGLDLEEVGETEYDVAQQVARKINDYEEADPPNAPNLTCDMEGNITHNKDKKSTQFTRIGFVNHIPVVIMRVDREPKAEGQGYKTLGAIGLMKAIDGYLAHFAIGADIGFATSSTYQPSREIDALSAMLELERATKPRRVGVITYGINELARVKGEHPTQPDLNQLAVEAHKAAKELIRLRQLLEPAPEQTTP